jgi:plastocyanin
VKRFRFIGVLAMLAAVALAVGACGSDEDESGSGSEAQEEESAGGGGGGGSAEGGGAGSTVELSATEFAFDPANPKVQKAGKVRFRVTNDGQTVHALEVEGKGVEAETEEIQPGQSDTLTADLSKPGTYELYCPIGNHKAQGMEGKVTVAGGGSGSSGSKEEDDSGGGGGGY